MINRKMTLDLTFTDIFCGGGGNTEGALKAGGKPVLAINHWKRAIETHQTNYPDVEHILTDLQETSPRAFPYTVMLTASPSCQNHSLAKGRKKKYGDQDLWEQQLGPDLEAAAQERSRCTMWGPLEWAEFHGHEAIFMENVVDVARWKYFRLWRQCWDNLGYALQFVSLNSMFVHPTPQSRDRLYMIATKKGNPLPNLSITPRAWCPKCEKDVQSVQCWKNGNTIGKYGTQYVYCCPHCVTREVFPYFYPAASIINWSLETPIIGARKKPLEEKTRDRIHLGLQKFSQRKQQEEHLSTAPFLFTLNHKKPRYTVINEQPLLTQTTYDATALLTPPFLLDHIGEYRPRPITGPISTICAGGNHQSLITTPDTRNWLFTYQNDRLTEPEKEPMTTVTTLERHGLLSSSCSPHRLPEVDECGFRMLATQEIQRGMGFRDDFIFTGTRREQVTQAGNATTPPVVELIMGRVVASLT